MAECSIRQDSDLVSGTCSPGPRDPSVATEGAEPRHAREPTRGGRACRDPDRKPCGSAAPDAQWFSPSNREARRERMRSTKIKLGLAFAASSVVALGLAAWAVGAPSAPVVGSGTASATKSVCGKGTGKKATGAPIKIGGIDMLIPGVDFTTIGKTAKAYFDCVNDNGGINGRPIKYI